MHFRPFAVLCMGVIKLAVLHCKRLGIGCMSIKESLPNFHIHTITSMLCTVTYGKGSSFLYSAVSSPLDHGDEWFAVESPNGNAVEQFGTATSKEPCRV